MADHLLLPLTPPGPLLLPAELPPHVAPPLPAPPRLPATTGAALTAALIVRLRGILMRIVRELWTDPRRLGWFIRRILYPPEGPVTPANRRMLVSRGNSRWLRELLERLLRSFTKGRAASIAAGAVIVVLYAIARASSPRNADEDQPPAMGSLPLFVRRNLCVMAFRLVPTKSLPLLPICRVDPARKLRVADEKNDLINKQAISSSLPKGDNRNMLTQAACNDKEAALHDFKEEDKSGLEKTVKMADAHGSRNNIEQGSRSTCKSLASFINTGSSSA